MKTDELITMLSTGPDVGTPAGPGANGFALLAAGILSSIVLMALTLGVRTDLLQVMTVPDFWVKLAFVVALTFAGWRSVRRLSVPGARTSTLPFLIAAPLVMMWILGVFTLVDAAPDTRAELFWGETWRYCPALIAMLSLPIFSAALWIVRNMAPTRLRLAGAAAGFAAGSAASVVYSFHCPEIEPSFIGFWYVLGILVPTVVGALVGRRVLAW